MKTSIPQFLTILIFILVTTLACNLFSGIGERVDQTRSTAQSVATDIQGGRDLIGTAGAIATDVGGSGLIETAQSLATEVGDSVLLETAQAIATEQGPIIKDTVQAFATQEGPSIKETAAAIATKAATTFGEAPPDIPIVSDENENFIASTELVSYLTSISILEVLAFYQAEMPNNGWVYLEEDSFETGNTAVLSYDKPDRAVTITLSEGPLGEKTIVLITIQPK